jgi:hypothetical protein
MYVSILFKKVAFITVERLEVFLEHMLLGVFLRIIFAFVFVPTFVTNKPVHRYTRGILK